MAQKRVAMVQIQQGVQDAAVADQNLRRLDETFSFIRLIRLKAPHTMDITTAAEALQTGIGFEIT